MSGKALVTPLVVACGVYHAGPSHGEQVRDEPLPSRCIVTQRTAEAAERLFWSRHNVLHLKNGVLPSANPVTTGRSPHSSFSCLQLSRFFVDRDVCHSLCSGTFTRPAGVITRRCFSISLTEQERNGESSSTSGLQDHQRFQQ